MYPHMIIRPPGRHLYLSQNTESHRSLHQTLLPPCLPCPLNECRIPNAAILPPPKYIITSQPTDSEPPFSVTTAHRAFPLPRSLSICHKYQIRPQRHQLRNCCLPLVNVRPQFLSSRFIEYPRHWRASPDPVPIPKQKIVLAPLFFLKCFGSLKKKGKHSRHYMLDFPLLWVATPTYYYSSIKYK